MSAKGKALIKVIVRMSNQLTVDEIHKIGVILIRAQRRIDGEED